MDLEVIIEEFKEKNYENFSIFYNETKRYVFYSASLILKDYHIDDIIQDTYIKFLENIDKYQPKTNIKAFLSKIAYNLAINTYNKEKRMVKNDDVINSKTQEFDPFISIEVNEILKVLSDDEKKVIVLKILNDLKFKEIASIINKPLGTVLWIYNKAMKKLRGGSDEK